MLFVCALVGVQIEDTVHEVAAGGCSKRVLLALLLNPPRASKQALLQELVCPVTPRFESSTACSRSPLPISPFRSFALSGINRAVRRSKRDCSHVYTSPFATAHASRALSAVVFCALPPFAGRYLARSFSYSLFLYPSLAARVSRPHCVWRPPPVSFVWQVIPVYSVDPGD